MTGVQGLRYNFDPFQGDDETLRLQQPAAGVMGQQEAENNMAIVIYTDIYITVYSQVQLLREPRPDFLPCPVCGLVVAATRTGHDMKHPSHYDER